MLDTIERLHKKKSLTGGAKLSLRISAFSALKGYFNTETAEIRRGPQRNFNQALLAHPPTCTIGR